MQLENLLERARAVFSQDELGRFERLKRHDVAEPLQGKVSNELDVVLRLEIAQKEHELALRRRDDQLHEKKVVFEKKHAALNQARNAKLKKQRENREKRIFDIRQGNSETGNSVAVAIAEKHTQAAIRRERIRERIVENARTYVHRPKTDGDVSGFLDARIVQEPAHGLTQRPRGPFSVTREPKSIKPKFLSRTKAKQLVAIDLEARNRELSDKLKSREEQVARTRVDIRRRLQDKSRKMDERCQKNLRVSREITADRQNRDLESYKKRHVLKDRVVLQKEIMTNSIKSFLERRLIHSKTWEGNREKMRRKEIIRHELRLHEILRIHQRHSTTDAPCDDERRVNRMRFKARRKRILSRIRSVKDSEELEKIRQKLNTVEIQ